MGQTAKDKPFNLLYKYDPQKTFIDKLYDYVTIQGRLIVVVVMFLVILAFIYRFPLDRKLNDEINKSNQNLELLDIYVKGNEAEYQRVIARTSSASKYMNLYSSDPTKDSSLGQVRFYDMFKRINEIRDEFGADIVIIDYNYTVSEKLDGIVNITGYSAQFTKAEEFREKLRLEKNFFSEALINNLGSNKEGIPQFALQLKVKDRI